MQMHENEVVMVVGAPASGKSTLSQQYLDQGYAHISRDLTGGKVADLVAPMIAALSKGRNVILDNTHPSAAIRKPFIDACKIRKVSIRCEWMDTCIEDAQINALHRMWDTYGKIFEEGKGEVGKKDPHVFPIAVLFRYRKEFGKPTTGEGFSTVKREKFVRRPATGTEKAIIFDYDGTLRESSGPDKWPNHPDEVTIMPGRKKVVEKYAKDHLLLGASNQAMIAKGKLSRADAVACFAETNKQLGAHIHDYVFCPHKIPPASCYCRKPQSGIGVYFIRKYNLDPAQVIMVGDQTTDKTFAKRLGFQYVDQKDFFE